MGRLREAPWRTATVLAIGYLMLRALNLWELWLASGSQTATGAASLDNTPRTYYVHTPTGASPGLLHVLANWDGQWYERIATDGYPDSASIHTENDAWTWAFPPLFPMLVRAVMAVSGLAFGPAAATVNVVLGAIATGLIFALLRRHLPGHISVVGALSVSTFVSAPLFVLAYSEPLALVLLLCVILLTLARRYGWAAAVIPLLALTRPITVPLAAVFAVHGLTRWRHRSSSGFSTSHRIWLVVCTIASLAGALLWGTIGSFLLGSAGRGSAPSGVARANQMITAFNFGWFAGVWDIGGASLLVLFVVLVGGTLWLAVVVARRQGLPPELQTWGVAYVCFVLLVTPVTPGIFRYLLLATPLLIAIPTGLALVPKRRLAAVAVSAVSIAGLWLQWLWIRYLYILDPAPALLPWAP